MPYAPIVAPADDSLTIIDVTDPTNPVFAGSIRGAGAPPGGNWLNSPCGLDIAGRYAFAAVMQDDALTILDIGYPPVPTFVGSIQGAGAPNWLQGAWRVQVVGNYAYVVAAWDDALTIIDVTDPTNPIFAGSIRGAGAPPGGNWLGGIEGVFVLGNYAYCTAALDDALTIIDVTDPTNPVFAGSIQGAGAPPGGNWLDGASDVYVVGNYAYVAADRDDSLTIIDVTNPLAPAFVSSIRGAGAPPGGNWLNGACYVQVVGNYAFITARYDSALTIIDVTNPLVPVFAGSIQGAGAPPGGNWLWGCDGVHVEGNYAYVGAVRDNALTIIDVTDPTNPVFAGSIRGAGAPNWLASATVPRALLPSIAVPTVSGRPATNIELTTATINGYLDDDGGAACDCGFEWGETQALGNVTSTQSRTTGQSSSQGLSHLLTHRIYYFRPFATNAAGTGYGAIRSFDIKGSAKVITRPATDIVGHGATLNGVVADDGGIPGDVRFQWGLTGEYGNETRWQSGYSTGDSFNEELSNLAEGNGYHFRAQFRNVAGIVSGKDMVFYTPTPLGPVTLVTDEIMGLLMEAV